MAVHVPLFGPGAVGHVQRKRLGVAVVVGNAAGEQADSLGVPLSRAGMFGDVAGHQIAQGLRQGAETAKATARSASKVLSDIIKDRRS